MQSETAKSKKRNIHPILENTADIDEEKQ